MSSTHIEINGKRYDARTGKLLADTGTAHKPAVKHTVTPAHRTADVKRPARTPSKQVHTSTERSKTLMRHAVKRPSKLAGPKPTPGKSMLDVAAPAVPVRAQSPLYHAANPKREARANKIKRSELVSKFSDFSRPTAQVQTRVEALPVATAPAHVHKAAAPASAASSIIERGLQNAQSHNQPAPHVATHHKTRRRKHSRLATAVASGMSILLLGAFITYQNVPNISMRYAASRAGVATQLPNYQPAGFSLNNRIQYTPGQITMSFKSNTDDRQFTITQRESSWNSETLRSNYVASTDTPVQTYEDKGRTIYLYGDSNATWVNAGVWYEIDGNSQLNSDQLIRIATSM